MSGKIRSFQKIDVFVILLIHDFSFFVSGNELAFANKKVVADSSFPWKTGATFVD